MRVLASSRDGSPTLPLALGFPQSLHRSQQSLLAPPGRAFALHHFQQHSLSAVAVELGAVMWGGRGQDKLLDQIFQLKFTSKTLVRSAKKCEKEEKSEKLKVKKAIEKGNMDGARIYAQNAIRKHNEQLNYLRLSSRLDAVVARLGTQSKMQTISKSMAGIVKSLDSALAVGNMEKISQTMDQFEKTFVNMEVQSEFIETAMAGSTSLSTPEDEVNSLLHQVADDYGLEVSVNLPQAGATAMPVKETAPANAEDDLSRRLAELKSRG